MNGTKGGLRTYQTTVLIESARGSAGEYQADERAGVAGLSWRVSG